MRKKLAPIFGCSVDETFLMAPKMLAVTKEATSVRQREMNFEDEHGTTETAETGFSQSENE